MFEFSLINMGIKTMAMLFIVLGLLVAVLYFMKKFPLFKKEKKDGGVIRIVSSLYLSPKEKIAVVEIAGEKIVLGITPGNISFLTKIHKTSSGNEEKSRHENHHEIKE